MPLETQPRLSDTDLGVAYDDHDCVSADSVTETRHGLWRGPGDLPVLADDAV